MNRATGFVENATGCVDRLVHAEAEARRGLDRNAVADLSRFIMNAAGFARHVITERVANAIERRSPQGNVRKRRPSRPR